VVQRILCENRPSTLAKHFAHELSRQWVGSLVGNDLVKR
jgi:hypothetical protein